MSEETLSLKSTKAEIYKAYQEALKQVRSKDTEKPQESVAKEAMQKKVEKATGLTSENIVKSIADLKINLTETLDKVEDALLKEFKQFSDLKDAIQSETAYLNDIYQIKTEADGLAVMLLAQKEKREEFESEERTLADSLQKQRENFEEEIKEKRLAWEKEKAKRLEEAKEETEQLKKVRKREEEEYSYQIQITRKKEQNEYAEKQAKLEKELAEKRIAFETEFQQREEQIKTREDELAELKTKVGNFPTELEKAAKQAEKILTEKMTTEFKYEKELLARETEGLLKLKDQTIQNLEAKIKEQENFIKQLNQKTETADKNVKEVVLKAIESSKVQWLNSAGPTRKKSEENES